MISFERFQLSKGYRSLTFFGLSTLLLFAGLVVTDVALAKPSAGGESGGTGAITIRLTGFRNNKGKAVVGLVAEQDRESFPRKGKAFFRSGTSEIHNGVATITFEQVPYGVYAITCFHDENENRQFDTMLLLGLPKEGYGFSNDARGDGGAPTFEQAKFAVNHKDMKIKIRIDYLF